MKATIELTEAEVKGIKAYVKQTDGDTWGKAEITQYVSGIVGGILHAPQEAVSDYIKVFEKNEYI